MQCFVLRRYRPRSRGFVNKYFLYKRRATKYLVCFSIENRGLVLILEFLDRVVVLKEPGCND